MEIKTKFNVHDLVQHKFQRKDFNDPRLITCYEVLDIDTTTCYAGTQIAYSLRPLGKMGYGNDIHDYDVAPAVIGEKTVIRLREDELKICPKELAELIRNSETAS